MFQQFLLGVLFTLIISCKNNADTTNTAETVTVDTTLKILIYGLPNMEQRRAMNTVAKKYGFTYFAVAGCIISEKLSDSVRKENKRVYEILERRFGNNWRPTFAAEVDTMQQLQQQVEALVKKEQYIINKESELEKDGNGLEYLIDPIAGQNTFDVKAYGWEQCNGETELVIYYKMTVDLSKKAVIKNSEVVERLYNRS